MSKSSSGYGFISLLYSIGNCPLGLWSKHVSSDGRVRRVEDDALNGDRVIEIRGPEASLTRTCISCPASPEDFLDIRLPVLVVVLKNLNARVQIAFQLTDEENIRRKFILSTGENGKPGIEPETARLPLKLDEGWNLLEIDLRSLCRTTYRTQYRALQRLIIYPNCRVRRIYLQDRHYEHNETPVELCQAFFDMYMLKWGIHFVEKSCQTNETHQEVKSASEKKQTSIQSENPLLVTRAKKTKSLPSEKLSAKYIRLSAGKGPTKKKKSSGNNVGNDKRKILKTETQMSKKSNGEIEEKSVRRISAIVPSPMTVDSNSKTNDGEGEIFRKWPYNSGVSAPRVNQSESNKLGFVNSRNIGAKSPIVVSSLGYIFPERNSTASRRLPAASLAPIAAIPSAVEVEASEATKNVESTRSKLLTTDEAVENFLELRHAINRKMLENFRGLTMTEVELSIYNSKNRRNSYGQGKLVERHRARIDKGCDAAPAGNAIETKGKTS